MAATIAEAFGNDRTRTKETHRLGSESATGKASTWRTFGTVTVFKDGHGSVRVEQNGKVIHTFDFGPEA